MYLSLEKDDMSTYISDLVQIDDTIHVMYADGRETVEPYIEHNMEVYRYRMEEQVKKYINTYHEYLNHDFRSYALRKIMMILIDINAFYMLYNIPSKNWFKVVSTILLILFNIYHFLMTSINMLADVGVSVQAQALEYFVNHKSELTYISSETHEETLPIHIEEISRFKVDITHLEAMVQHIKNEYEKGNKEIEPDFGVVSVEKVLQREESLKKTK